MHRWATCAVLAGFLAVIEAPGAEPKANPEPPGSADVDLTRAHKVALAALRAERDKLALGKSTLFNVCEVAKQFRDAELRMSTSAPQRIAAHTRHVALLKELKNETARRVETGVVAPLELKLVTQELQQAEAALLRAKGKAE